MINRQPSELPEHNDGHERNRQPPIVLRRQKNPRCSLSNTAQFGSDADSAPVPPSAALKNRDLPDESLTYSECRVKELLSDSVQKRKRRLFRACRRRKKPENRCPIWYIALAEFFVLAVSFCISGIFLNSAVSENHEKRAAASVVFSCRGKNDLLS